MKRIKWLVMLFVAVQMSACAVRIGPGVGTTALADADQASLERDFVAGQATSKDVLLKLGPPASKNVAAGYEVWGYRYVKPAAVAVAFVATPIGSTKKAEFYFQESTGVLEKVAYIKESH